MMQERGTPENLRDFDRKENFGTDEQTGGRRLEDGSRLLEGDRG